MNILCLGAGDVGTHLAKTLRSEGHLLTVVDQDLDKLNHLENQSDVRTILGNGASLLVLEKADAANADLVLCVTADDEVNMMACLLAKGLGAKHVVVRVKNPEYLAGRRYFYRKVLGCDFLISPEEMASEEICKVVNEHSTVAVEFFADGRVQMRQIRLPEESPLIGKKSKELQMPGLSLLVAIFRGGDIIIPSGETELKGDDSVLVVGDTESSQGVVDFFGEKNSPGRNIVIVGGGEVGMGVARNLEAKDYKVTLIEESMERAKYLSETLPQVTIIHGNGMSADVLKEERVDSADVLVSTCKEDEKNFIICQLSKELGVSRTIASVEKSDYVPLFQKLGVDVTVSPRLVTSQRITRYVMRKQIHSLAVLQEGKAEVLEMQTDEASKVNNIPLSKLGLPKGSVVGVIVRGNEVLIPRGETQIQPRDRVIIFTLVSIIPKIVKLFS